MSETKKQVEPYLGNYFRAAPTCGAGRLHAEPMPCVDYSYTLSLQTPVRLYPQFKEMARHTVSRTAGVASNIQRKGNA